MKTSNGIHFALTAALSLGSILTSPPGCGSHALFASNTSPAAPGPSVEATELGIGTPVAREISGGQSHFYEIRATAGQYLRLVVDRRGVDVELEVRAPDGASVARTDRAGEVEGTAALSMIVDLPGVYRLEIRLPDASASAGRYEVRLDEIRKASPRDRDLVAGERDFAEAQRLQAGMTAESLGNAAGKYDGALKHFRAAAEDQKCALTLSKLGEISYLRGDMPSSLDHFTKAIDIIRALKDEAGEAEMLANIGLINNALGNKDRAIESLNRSVAILRTRGDKMGEAGALNNLGLVYWSVSENAKALECYTRVLAIVREAKEAMGEVITLNNIAAVYDSLGEKRKALEYHNQALPLRRALNDKRGEAITLSNIGAALSSLDEIQAALDDYNAALGLLRDVGDKDTEASVLNNVGDLYNSVGETETALSYYKRSQALWEAAGNRGGQAVVMNNMGAVRVSLGDTQEALGYYDKALSLARSVQDRSEEANVLHNIGSAYAKADQPQKAMEYYNQALPLRIQTGDKFGEAATLHNMGMAEKSVGHVQESTEYLNGALSVRRDVADRGGEAETLWGLAELEFTAGKLSEARRDIEAALDIVESIRAGLATEKLRASYFATAQRYYEFYIRLLMEMNRQKTEEGHEREALEASERARARSLLEMLAEGSIDIRAGVDEALLQKERSLRERLSAKAERQIRLLSGKHTPAQAAALASEIASLTHEYQQVEAEIREKSPHYAALTQPAPLGVGQIQEEITGEGAFLLEYALGDEESYCWVVGPDRLDSYRLPGRAEIEASARDVYRLLNERNRQVDGESLTARRARIERADLDFRTAAVSLSQMILGPLAKLSPRRLLVVADGALQYVPFAALPLPPSEGAGPRQAYEPLVARCEVLNLPSASALAELRREVGDRKPASKTVAVFADPVFERGDPRVGASASTGNVETPVSPFGVGRAVRDIGLGQGSVAIPRLPFTRREAQSITRSVPAALRKLAMDFDASRGTAMSDEISQYRIVHFATHGILDNVTPELSGVLLSLVDPKGGPQDGFLKLYDIYNMRLAADLVVLSACQTALGKEIKGEGLVGLTRGFMYAGSKRVLASLWKVEDTATAELMNRFYDAMLGTRRLPPAAALRAAQIGMLKSPRWSQPFYWAAFVLQGDWN
ncbi:MAG: CHAT domain-containing protein [Acidobacteriota bacterium]